MNFRDLAAPVAALFSRPSTESVQTARVEARAPTDPELEEPPIPVSPVARRRPRAPWFARIVTCALLVGVLAGCVVVAERQASVGRRVGAPRRVVFVGDSIT